MKILQISLVAFSFFSLSTAHAKAVAVVNGQKISEKEFEKAYAQNRLYVGPERVTKEKVLNDLINRELGIQKAKKEKLDENPTVKYKMNDVLYHAQVSKDLEPQFKGIKVTNKDVKNYYQDHKEYRTAHILFRVKAEPEKKELEAALKAAMSTYQKLKKDPNKFAKLANELSQTSAAPNGGDIGYQPAFRLAPEYFAAIKGKDEGHITSPVRTQFGFHIIKVLGVKDYDDINKDLYKKFVYDQKRDKLMDQYFKKLRTDAKVKVNKENL